MCVLVPYYGVFLRFYISACPEGTLSKADIFGGNWRQIFPFRIRYHNGLRQALTRKLSTILYKIRLRIVKKKRIAIGLVCAKAG